MRIFGLFLALVFSGSLAWAYIPPSQFVVDKIVKKREDRKGIWVKSKAVLHDGGEPTDTWISEITMMDYKKNRFYSRVYDSTNVLLFSSSRSLSSRAPKSAPLVSYLLFTQSPQQLAAQLVRAGIPIKTSAMLERMEDEAVRRSAEDMSLKRWNNHYAWVIGREMKGNVRGQFWVEKDSFLPQRWIKLLGDESDPEPEVREVQFSDWRFSRGVAYPGMIQVMESGQVQLSVKMEKIAVNPKKKFYDAPTESGLTQEGKDAGGTTRQLMDYFYKYVR